jgi:beta-1,4-mannosyl-glycoprotein beta-1,4-N-acetylglucosaminyltransferase
MKTALAAILKPLGRRILALPSRTLAAFYALAASRKLIKPRVYDCFLLYEERELFELRVHELARVVDVFVVVEGSLTFTGKARQRLVGPDLIQRLPPEIQRKIRYIPIHAWEYPPGIGDVQWEVEYFTRNQLVRGLYDARPLDFVWLSDVDEIPRPTCAYSLGTLDMHLAHYKFNLISTTTRWRLARAITGHEAKRHSMTCIRLGKGVARRLISDAGWHFSYLMTAEQITDKLNSFSHQELNTESINNISHIEDCMHSGRSIYGEAMGAFVKQTDLGFLPSHLIANKSQYSHFLA